MRNLRTVPPDPQVALVRSLMKWVGRDVTVNEARSAMRIFAGKEDRYDVPQMSIDDADWIRRTAGPVLVHFGYASAADMRVGRERRRGSMLTSVPHFITGLANLRGQRRQRSSF